MSLDAPEHDRPGGGVLAHSVPGVCDIEEFPPPTKPLDSVPTPRLLIEVPHGATAAAHFDTLRRRLGGSYPDDLREFFFVNTDVGAPEAAREIALRVAAGDAGAAPARVVLLRCLIPRTWIDVNRLLDADPPDYAATGITPGLPEYVTDPADVATLRSLHDRYQRVADELYDAVCGAGGLALMLHSYAPRSVDVDRVDAGIVQALRRAYEPDRYPLWPRRPEVEIIDRAPDGSCLSPKALARAVEEAYGAAGIEVKRNVTYRLEPATAGHRHARRHPESVLCVEINRELLADPFDPFVEMRISPANVSRMAAPLARAVAAVLAGR